MRTILDADKRLSESLLWEIQRRYFLDAGISAWSNDVVPHQLSCSPFIAKQYAHVALAYLRDLAADPTFEPNSEQSIYFIELGAGSGRLMWHFIQHFLEPFSASPFAGWPIKFLLTDFAPTTVESWKNNPKLQTLVDDGLLELVLYDVDNARDPHSLPKGKANIFLANYFFDSIPQDTFVIEDGQLCDNLLTLSSSQPEPDLTDAKLWDRLQLHYESIPLKDEPYEDETYNEIMAIYAENLPDTVLTFPNVGLDLIQSWQRNGAEYQLWLTADRGHTLPDSLIGQSNPIPNLHGSFSLMVNYHAINQFVWMNEGVVCHPAQYQNNIQVLAYLLGVLPNQGQETQAAFDATVGSFGPDDYQELKMALLTNTESLSLPQLLSLYRLGEYDFDLLIQTELIFEKHILESEPVWWQDISLAFSEFEASYLSISSEDKFEGIFEQLFQLFEGLRAE